MNKKFLIITVSGLMLNLAVLLPQPAPVTETVTFDQAINLALQNNPDLKIKDLNYLISAEKLSEARLQMIPQIHGRYDLQRNLIIPSTLVPIGKFNPAFPPDELMPIKFGTNWVSTAGLVASVKLFDPQIIGDIKEKKAAMSLYEIEKKITRADLETETGKAYASCLLSSEQLRFAAADTMNSYRQLAESQLKFRSGMLKQTDLNQSVINHNSSVIRYNEAYRIWLDSRKTLMYWMGLDEGEKSLVLSDSLDMLISRLGSFENETRDISSSLTLIKLTAESNVDRIKLRNVKTGFLPVVSLNGILANDYYNNQLHLGRDDYWFGNSYVNLSLQIPITEGIQRTRRITQQKYQIEAGKEEMKSALNRKQLDISRVKGNIDFYRKEMTSGRSNLQLAQANYNASFSLFREGRILPSELLEAETSFKLVKMDYLKAVFNYVDALLELKRILQT